MKNVGIVAEFNPFHQGHNRLISLTRKRFGESCAVICCMSGHFVQRGEPAFLDKWKRAALSLAGGADLILELPTPCAAASAQRFARGAVGLLSATGLVDVLAFGSESGDLAALQALEQSLESEPYQAALRTALDRGAPFAVARAEALFACAGDAARCLDGPNDTLGVEYLSALRYWGSSMEVMAVQRTMGRHDAPVGNGVVSASAIRTLLRAGETEAAFALMPEGCRPLMEDAVLSDWGLCERAVLARLRGMAEEDFLTLPDCGEGLHRRLMAAAEQAATLPELLELAKTKRYTAARIRRAVLWAFLGLRQKDIPEKPPYIRVLGFNQRGRAVLRQMQETATPPVLTRASQVRELGGTAEALMRMESRCTDLYALTLPQPFPCGREWREGPVVIDK
ncbi:MAG: nucleotidyltransferase family protein [Oscillospiraceae bacterium]|nr:nucleotidyltransferase family protein [Oscillospiraceae bacterium]